MSKRINQFFHKQTVLSIAILAMLLTILIIPPDHEYLGYFNFRTLATLFCTLAVVNAFSHIHVFEILSRSIVEKFYDLRKVTIALVMITYFGSMLLANDMALLTFLPLGYYVLSSTEHEEDMAFVFIMQNIAANLGGMITPFGNPQNLYLFSYYSMSNDEFVTIMLPSFLAAFFLIIGACFFVKPVPLTLKSGKDYELDVRKTVLYSVLFFASILIVFRIFPYLYGTIIITLILLALDRKAVWEVNYPLLATFCVFFVFSGNMSRISVVKDALSWILGKNTLLFGILSCQMISNVPSAVLLSHFTTDVGNLLPAVNIGGLGTLIASLASLITYFEYKKHCPEKRKEYVVKFSAINFSFLLILFFVQTGVNLMK